MKGPSTPGQPVKLTGDDEFTVCAAVTDVAVGILGSQDILEHETAGATDLNQAVIWMDDGNYKTKSQFLIS